MNNLMLSNNGNDIALTDHELVGRCEVLYEQIKALVIDAPPNEVLQEQHDRLRAVKAWITPKFGDMESRRQAINLLNMAILQTERAIGEHIKAWKAQGLFQVGNPQLSKALTIASPTLSDVGISSYQSSNYQALASAFPTAEALEAELLDRAEQEREITRGGLYKHARAKTKKKKRDMYRAKAAPESRDVSDFITLYEGRAEALPLPDGCVDLIITSPPYNLGATFWPMGGDGRMPRTGGIGYGDNLSESAYQEWQVLCLMEMYRVARPGASLFYNHKTRNRDGSLIHPMDWLRDARIAWTLRQEIIWDRGSTHNHNPLLFWPEDERVYWFTKGKPHLSEQGINMSCIWRFHGPVVDTWHPAPFDSELPRRCIKALGLEDITVLDPFAGSCTTVKTAYEFGLSAIGVDIAREYLETACEVHGWSITIR